MTDKPDRLGDYMLDWAERDMTNLRTELAERIAQMDREAILIERLRTERDGLRADNERLKAAKPGCLYHCECDRLATDNERLRAVMRRICLLDGETDALSQIFDEVHREMDSWRA